MQAATNATKSKSSQTPNVTSTASSLSNIFKGRQLESMPAASPRISCHSRWWNALGQGGVKGWYHWLVGVLEYERLSIAEKLKKPHSAAQAISHALKEAAANEKISVEKFSKLIKNANWYGTDVDQTIRSTLLNLNSAQLENIKNACNGQDALVWLSCKVGEVEALVEKLANGIFESAVLSNEGFMINGPCRKLFWEEMDHSFASVSKNFLNHHISSALSKDGVWKLLPFAEIKLNGGANSSKVLEQACVTAWEKISKTEGVDFGKLTDSELHRFLALTLHHEMKHHAVPCQEEIKRRACILDRKKLTLHLEKRVAEITAATASSRVTDVLSSEENLFQGFSMEEISNLALNVIVKLSPADLLTVSKLESESLSDMWLNEIAKAQLKAPSIKMMSDAKLIEYLTFQKGEFLSSEVRNALIKETGDRAEIAYAAGYRLLQAGLQSDSYNGVVRDVLEFSDLLECGIRLQNAAGLENSSENIPEDFSSMLNQLTENQTMRARHLALDLDEGSHKQAGKMLSWAIHEIRAKAALVTLSPREKELMKKAIFQHTPNGMAISSERSANQVGAELGSKFIDLFNAYILNDDDFRRVRDVKDGELPVSMQFVKDQRSSDLQFEGKPLFNKHISFATTGDTKRAQEFVRKMRSLKGITDDQIMTASRIATQSASAVLAMLARSEKLFSLNEDEAKTLDFRDTPPGLIPSHLDHQENFLIEKDGSLTVHARIFQENAEKWSGQSGDPGKIVTSTFQTNPENSSFSAELTFKVDPKGVIQEVVFGNLAFERTDISRIEEEYGKVGG